MRMSTFVRSSLPYMLVLFAAIAGGWLGSERYGLQTSYEIDPALTAERIEQAYSPLFVELLALSREHDPTDHRRRLEQLADRLKGHEELLGIDLEVRPTEGVTRVETLYSPAPAGSSNCVMRSVAANRSGLIRCRARGTSLAVFDYLRVTRPIQRDTQATVLAILRLDYHKLRQRLRKNSAGAGATLRG